MICLYFLYGSFPTSNPLFPDCCCKGQIYLVIKYGRWYLLNCVSRITFVCGTVLGTDLKALGLQLLPLYCAKFWKLLTLLGGNNELR